MNKLFLSIWLFLSVSTAIFGQDNPKDNRISSINFDYSGYEILEDNFLTDKENLTNKILNHKGYRLILEHSQKYSSQPIQESDLIDAVNGKITAFDFQDAFSRKDTLNYIIDFIKNHEDEIINEYASLSLKYLPKNYSHNVTLYFVVGGYNGIAMNNKVCINIDHDAFRKNPSEIKSYIAHELFHIGFESYHELPDLFNIKTVAELKNILLSLTMNEGLATLTPFQKRIEINEVNDYDYQILLDSIKLEEKLYQFDNLLKYLDDNMDKEFSFDMLGYVFGQGSGDRLFYIVGCHIGLTIEKEYGSEKIVQLVSQKDVQLFFDTYNNIK